MRKTRFFAVVACAAALLASRASAQVGLTYTADQDIFKDSVTIASVQVGTAFAQVDTPQLARSWIVRVINIDTANKVCCSFDSAASTTPGSAKSCEQIDQDASGFINKATFKRWAQNLSLFCRTLAGSGTSELRILQGR